MYKLVKMPVTTITNSYKVIFNKTDVYFGTKKECETYINQQKLKK